LNDPLSREPVWRALDSRQFVPPPFCVLVLLPEAARVAEGAGAAALLTALPPFFPEASTGGGAGGGGVVPFDVPLPATLWELACDSLG
jgi:hypothetical protein